MLKRPETLSEAVINYVRDAILTGEYPAGSPLAEGVLATQLGTSRGTIREALRTLADDGLVDLFPHRRARVSTITLEKAREIYEARAILEPQAVRIGAERGLLREHSYTVEVRRALDALREAVAADDRPLTVGAERHLHRLLWMSCEQTVLIDILSGLQIQTRRILIYTRAFERGDLEVTVHAELVEEALSGDPTRAEKATLDHLLTSRDHMIERMAQLQTGSGTMPGAPRTSFDVADR